METVYHVLNGDALFEHFPKSIKGKIIVARECLVDGNVSGSSLEELFSSRAAFLSENYGESRHGYFDKVVPEFQKIISLDGNSEINLWFEDDLFCQVNLWFVAWLLVKHHSNHTVFLIRPTKLDEYGFGGLSESELISIYSNRIPLRELDEIASLWSFYQENDLVKLGAIAQELQALYPFILVAVQAHIERNLKNESEGRPIESLRRIMSELGTREFGPVFREFNRRESVYGFGDLQVKRLFDMAIDIN